MTGFANNPFRDAGDAPIDPLAFFAGVVTQRFSQGAGRVEAVDLDRLIDREAKRIRSATGELDWDWEQGVLTVCSPMCEGVIGFFSGREVRLGHVAVQSRSEYLTVMAVTLDELPLCESKLVLLQVMTEDRLCGWREEGNVIADTGGWPINVRDIDGTVTLTGMVVDTVTRLDPNGEPAGAPHPLDADGRVKLCRDGMYTVLSKGLPTARAVRGAAPIPRRHAPTGRGEPGWWAFEPPPDSFTPSPMDLRFMNEEAAGKHGFVTRDGSMLRLGDGSPVRFWAVNAGPRIINRTSEEIDYLAARLAKMGVNLVRMHGPVWDSDADRLESVPAQTIERYHYFIYAMKRQGIYVKLSFYFPLWIRMKPEYGFEGYEGKYLGQFPFALLQYDERFQEIYKGWARQLLLPMNPYTGIPLVNEPAVAFIEVQNEDSYLFGTFNRSMIPPAQFERIGRHFHRWVLERYGSTDAAYAAWGPGCGRVDDDPDNGVMAVADIDDCTTAALAQAGVCRRRLRDQMEFLVAFQKEFYRGMVEFYRREIGTPSLLTASNWMTVDPRLMEGLERYTYTEADAIDRHGYFEEGHTGAKAEYRVLPGHTFTHLSALKNPDKAIMQINRVEGWPHMITETAWPMPNRHKGESVPMWSIFGSLQGINAIFIFALGDVDWEEDPANKWPLLTPAVFGQFPAFARLFRLGMVTEAPPVVRVSHSLPSLMDFAGSPIYEAAAIDELRKTTG